MCIYYLVTYAFMYACIYLYQCMYVCMHVFIEHDPLFIAVEEQRRILTMLSILKKVLIPLDSK